MSSFKPMQSTFTEFDHSSYISIVSNYNFYELLLQKAYKCMLLQIPQTILFFEGYQYIYIIYIYLKRFIYR